MLKKMKCIYLLTVYLAVLYSCKYIQSFATVNTCFLFTVASQAKKVLKAPVWSETYTVRGELVIPYAELVEPFYAWYDAASKQSRIDYYGDMVKTYQLGSLGPYGASLKIAPITTENELNARTCLQVNGTDDYSIKPQSILPSLIGFECIGVDTIDDVPAEKWQLVETVGQKVNKYTMWLKYKDDPDNAGIKIAVPVRYEMKGFNSLLGSHYDHYYLNYQYYDTSAIPDETFRLNPSNKYAVPYETSSFICFFFCLIFRYVL